ncbi:MAG: adenylate/guanylate cyclase domain-containing protein [Clostridia bacterium]
MVTIRKKIIFIVLPLLLTPLLLSVLVSSLSARNGISIIAADFLRFKNEIVLNYAQSQWELLENNGFVENTDFVNAAKNAVGIYADTIIQSESEVIFAIDSTGNPVMSTRELILSLTEKEMLVKAFVAEDEGWRRLELAGERYVGQGVLFKPFGWYVVTAEKEQVFYLAVSEIFKRTAILLSVSVFVAVVLLVVFAGFLTKPIKHIVEVIQEIISTGNLSRKVELLYSDETGQLGHYFNLMTGELENAYSQIKKYAYEMVLAKNKERRIRTIFQKYVPKNVIEQFESNPETMLKGDNRKLAVLFSDIRSFTTISESMKPDVLVESLNNYFEKMVDVITGNDGIVDKYIGDAIMAFFGAPVKTENDALASVKAGLGMMAVLKNFNKQQVARGLIPFKTGIGINYGVVTVGNIGSEKKMDYTVIGDMVNLASRLEGLTKIYHEPIIVSESVIAGINGEYPARLLDRVVVKGKSTIVPVYTLRESLNEMEKAVWSMHDAALHNYIQRNFTKARHIFTEILKAAPEDQTSSIYVKRCNDYLKNPPPESWRGEFFSLTK